MKMHTKAKSTRYKTIQNADILSESANIADLLATSRGIIRACAWQIVRARTTVSFYIIDLLIGLSSGCMYRNRIYTLTPSKIRVNRMMSMMRNACIACIISTSFL